jgi:hypothetical protein
MVSYPGTVNGNLSVSGTGTFTGAVALNGGGTWKTLLDGTGAAANTAMLGTLVTNDTFDRFRLAADGTMTWGPGNGARDTTLDRSGVNALETLGFFAMGSGQSGGTFSVFGGAATSLQLGTAGGGLAIKEGANARQGVSTMVAGTVTVANTSVTANTRIQLTVQSLGTVTAPKAVAVTARVAGTSFTITSADATDTSVVAWDLFEPA